MTTPTQAAIEAARERVVKAIDGGGTSITALAIALQEMSDAVKRSLGDLQDGCEAVTRNHLSPFILPDPVDPLLIEARKIASDKYGLSPERDPYLRGENDEFPAVRIALTALRRGMELAKVQP